MLTVKILIRLGGCPGWSESSLSAQSFWWFCHVAAQIICYRYWVPFISCLSIHIQFGEHGGSVIECQTPEREVGCSKPTSAMLCPWARHFTPRKYWLSTQEAVAPSQHDWKIVDWDVKPQHKQTNIQFDCFSVGREEKGDRKQLCWTVCWYGQKTQWCQKRTC